MLDLFQYVDYQVYLRDWLASIRTRRGFSLRQFAARAGLGSPAYLKMVIDGKRNLGEEGLEMFMNGLRLEAEQRLFFRNLVLWNQAETDEDRSHYEGKLTLLRKCRVVRPKAISEIKEKIVHLRHEMAQMLGPELTQEEALLLLKQILPD